MCTVGQDYLTYFSHLVRGGGGNSHSAPFVIVTGGVVVVVLYLVLGIEPMAKQVDYTKLHSPLPAPLCGLL